MKDILFQIAEYAGIPIGLMLFTILGNELCRVSPITTEKKENIWTRGLELMQIICSSTLLFGISFLGHTSGEELSKNKLIVIAVAFAITLVEIIWIMVTIVKIRGWGTSSVESQKQTNISAVFFWIVLVVFISVSHLFLEESKEDFIAATRNQNVTEKEYVDYIKKHQNVQTNEIIITRKNYSLLLIITLITFTTLATYIVRQFLENRRKAIMISYSKAIELATTNDPSRAIANLKLTLKRAPADSALIIDVYMKLAKIYMVLNEYETALKQVFLAQNSQAYQKYPYLRDGVLSFLVRIYLETSHLDLAEQEIFKISSEYTAAKLRELVFKAKNK
jgi:predicted negative regulator of RcsB-dependent stress response